MACIDGGGTVKEMLVRIKSGKLWGPFPNLEGFAVRGGSLYVCESGGIWGASRMTVCDNDTGRVYTRLGKLFRESEIEKELKVMYGEE